ncbi:mitotic-spindle organizing gamma-tubulin ring associated-domain-containing protein [Lipomyces kononenkoae]|uniref:Mitotic-spindle organizing gamma-tubulin ring associated-domain-containing protein n=1 Tax=Lipomyces kononenkoae TaxID=34357 RepID=A0ACC3T0K3_LIPKO
MTLSTEYIKADSSASSYTPNKVVSRQRSRSDLNTTQKDAADLLYEISLLLDTGVDKDTIAICLKLCDNGINPEALANTIRELTEWSISQRKIHR